MKHLGGGEGGTQAKRKKIAATGKVDEKGKSLGCYRRLQPEQKKPYMKLKPVE